MQGIGTAFPYPYETDDERDRDDGTGEALRADPRAGRRGSPHPSRIGLRLAGPQRRRQDHDLRILTTLLEPTAGSATVLGHDVVREADAVRRKVSLTGQFASVDEDLTGQENLVLVGRLLGLSWRDARQRAAELLEVFGLPNAVGRQVRTYSGGERRRIDIAASLVAIPEVLFLDKPTTGLDPRSRTQVWDLVRRIAAEGTTVLLTTQYLDEADRLAGRDRSWSRHRRGNEPRAEGVRGLERPPPAPR